MTLKEFNILKGTGEERNAWEHAKKTAVFYLVKNILNSKKRKNRVLNIGHRDIWTITKLVNSVSGEFYIVPATLSESKFALPASGNEHLKFYPSLDKMVRDVSKPLDAVLLVNVIESIVDDIGFLKLLLTYEFISANTKIVIIANTITSGCKTDKNVLRAYTKSMLVHHVNRAGLVVEHSGYFFYTGLLVNKLNLKFLLKPKKEMNKILFYLTNGLMIADFLTCYVLRLLRINIPGDTCFVICNKP